MLLVVGVCGYFGTALAGICVSVIGGFAWAFPDVTGMRGRVGHAGGAEHFVTMMRFVLYCGLALQQA